MPSIIISPVTMINVGGFPLLVFLLATLTIGSALLSSPSRDPTRPDFQTSKCCANIDFVVLFTGSASNVSGTSATYRNETYIITYTSGAISTTNTIQAGLGIVRNYFDFAGSTWKWDLSIPSFTSTTMDIMVSANGSNVVTELGISYLVKSSLLFEVLYASITFAASDDVKANTNQDNPCSQLSTSPSKKCYITTKVISYGGTIMMDTTQSLKVRLFVSGVQVVNPSGNGNVGWLVTTTGGGNPGSTSFTVSVVAFENTALNYISFFYVLYQSTTITADATNVLVEGTISYGCLYNTSSCTRNSPDSGTINSAGPIYTPYVYFLGFSMLYTTGNGGDEGSFNLSSSSVNGNNYNLVLYFVGNNNPSDYRMRFSYIIFQKISCAGYAIDKYLTLDRKYCNQTCNAGIGQYFDVDNWCQACDATCYSCVSTSATCTACYTTAQNRVLNGATNTCDCNVLGYYSDGVSDICPACHYSCISCTSSTFSSCTACDLTVQHRLINVNTCPCTTGYYDNSLPNCVACHYSCQTCSTSGSTGCLSCNSTVQFRTLSASSCLCNTGYYDNGVAVCATCHYTCLTCSGGSTSNKCSTCSTTAFRYQTGNTCPCNVGYYDVGPTVMTCSLCHPTCYTCNGPLNTNCLACNATQNRGIVLNRCDCKTHYYDFGGTCYVCDYTCENCTGSSNIACSTCAAANFRTLSATSCPCNTGYYDAGVAGCLICSYACQGCVTSSTNCLACNASNHRSSAGSGCPCDSGYVDTLVSMCSACYYYCVTCTSILNTGCSSCDATHYLSGGRCLCLTHTYDNGVNNTCGTCHYTCQNCSSQYSTGCLTCVATDLRTISGTSCPCNARYYDAGIATCQPCYYTCLTCTSNTVTTCSTCSAGDFRTIVSNQCLCITHYYQNGVSVCATCTATCLNCTAFSTCTACDSTTNFRTLFSSACICMNGYYDTGATACAVCAYQCLTCVTSSTNCLSCNTTAQRTLGSAVCPCNFGYYDSGITMCSLCYYSCDSCTGGLINNCQSCNSTALRTMSGTSCVCPAGYYDNGSSEMCQLCYFKCQNCSSYLVCTSCDSTLYRALSLGTCGCMAGYFDTGTTMCSPCDPTCVTCNGLLNTNCLTCSAAAYRTFSSWMCVCMAGYYEAGSNTCAACSYTCLSCSVLGTNCTSCTFSNRRSFLANACPCNAGYFDNGAGLCASCDPKCATCVSTSTNCLTCNTSQLTVLSGNQCVCQSTAYLNTTNSICYACNGYCVTCTTSGNLSCTSCTSTLRRTLSGTTCLCTAGYYEAGIPMCGTCHTSCLTCFGGNTAFNCTSCNPGFVLFTSTCLPSISCANYYFENQCINTCPNYTYPSTNICFKCTNNCYTCTSAVVCTTCQTGYKFQPSNNTCNTACTQLQYEQNGICYSCPSTCQSCLLLNGSVVCTSCNTSYNFYQGSCLLNCPVNVTVSQSGVCVSCVKPCVTCFGVTSEQCYSCIQGYTMLGTECLAQCPTGMYSSSIDRYCYPCPTNCSVCREGGIANISYCTACNSGLYPSNGMCLSEGFFLDSSSIVVQCHPNCQTCTNSSFSSCIKCQALRGDSNQQAILGYCDCQQGSVDLSNGICDKSLYKTISTANSFLVSSSASVFGTSLAVGVVSSNLLNFERFMGYNQIISQYYYLNASVPASTDIVFQYLGMANIGNFLSSYGENKPLSRRRMLYDNSTQSLDSLFLHRHTTYQVQTTCMHILIINGIVWLMIALLSCLVPCLDKRYVRKPTKCLAKTIKILRYWLSIFKYKVAVKIILLTATEASFNVAVSLKLTDFGHLTTADIISFSLACLLAVFYVIMLFVMFVSACTTKLLNKKDPFAVLYADFQQRETYKWYRMIYIPMLILRCLLIQLLIVVLSFMAFYQGIVTCGVQLVFLIYTLLCNPFAIPWSICSYLTEFLLTAQVAILTVISYVPESDRLKYTFILIALNYAQMCVFGLFCLGTVMRMVYDAIVECRNKNRVYAEQISEHSHNSDAESQKQMDLLQAQPDQQQPSNVPQKAQSKPAYDFNDSQFELREEDVPSVHDIQEGERIKKRYRVQKRRNVFDEE